VDGTFELFRCWFGAPKAQTSEGLEVGAVRGLLRTIHRLIREDGTTHVGIAFDRVIESFRNQLFDGYKTGDGIEPDLLGQFPLAEEAARALGVVVWPMIRYEADDALASAAARWRDDVDQVQICSPDKDLAQCVVGTRVILRDRLRDKAYDEAGVLEKYGVRPTSIPDWLALVGDKADGIPGIPRWGAKSAATVLRHYGSFDQIPANPDAWAIKVRGAKTLAANLNQGRGEASLYKRLATLRLDVPIPQTLADLEWKGAHRQRLSDVCRRLEDNSFESRIDRWVP
jgi:5'-3' exonuclease